MRLLGKEERARRRHKAEAEAQGNKKGHKCCTAERGIGDGQKPCLRARALKDLLSDYRGGRTEAAEAAAAAGVRYARHGGHGRVPRDFNTGLRREKGAVAPPL